MSQPRSIAIVGAAGRFPGAADLGALWRNVLAGHSAARDVSAERWPVPASDLLDPQGGPDRTRSAFACVLEPFELDPTGLELPPELLARTSPLAKLTLGVGAEAFASAKLTGVDRARIGVVLANIALPTDGASKLAEELFVAALDEQVLGHPPPAGPRADPLERFPSALPAGLLARALGLGGGSFTLDAACASSLYALHLACCELEAGRLDAVIAGGVCLPQTLYTQVGFTQLQALSPSGRCAPFDSSADGLVVGEGAGMFVLRRLEDATAAGEKIHAVIRGIGLSNDVGGSLLSPDSEGQLRATRAAYAQAGWAADEVELIECHGTGTPRGDAVELQSLTTLWQGTAARGCVLGSVKSNIGHLLTAAGAAGLCKVLSALEARTLPPSANFSADTSAPGLKESGFRVLERPEAWPERLPGRPRRAAVSGFGFGGINAHLLLEEATPAPRVAPRAKPRLPPIAIVGMATHFGRLDSLAAFRQALLRGEPVRDERPADRWTGLAHGLELRGAWLKAFEVPLGRFRIPPRELASLLPQQVLMLKVAAEALEDARGLGAGPHLRTGAVVGLGLDLDTTSFHLRWLMQERVRRWAKELRLQLSSAEAGRWTADLCEALGPALDSTRTLGALGGIVASRLAREFQLGGPSFAVAGEEASGLRALEVAARMLQRGEVDVMLAGAVDLAGDLRQVLATDAVRPFSRSGKSTPFDDAADGPSVGEGAAALVLKRLDDALAAGDRIYATVRGLGASGGAAVAGSRASVAAGGATLSNGGASAAGGGASVAGGGATLSNGGAAVAGGGAAVAGGGAAVAGGGASVAGGGAAVAGGGAAVANSGAAIAGGGESVARGRAAVANSGAAIAGGGESVASGRAAVAGGGAAVANSGASVAGGGAAVANGSASGVEGAAGASRTSVYVRALERAHAEAGVTASQLSLLHAHGSGDPSEDRDEAQALQQTFGGSSCALASSAAIIGQTGAASGLASVVASALCLFEEMLPPLPGFLRGATPLEGFHVPLQAQVWLRDRARGPRLAGVSSIGIDGSCVHAVLEGVERRGPPTPPSHERSAALFLVHGDDEALRAMLERHAGTVEQLAARWHRRRQPGPVTRAVIAANLEELRSQLDRLAQPPPVSSGELAFVFPGSGNHYVGMGQSLGLALPEVYRRLDAEVEHLQSQLMPRWVTPQRSDWSEGWEEDAARALGQAPERMILGQVAHGVAVSDALQLFGLRPTAYLGYSLGESAALFASRTWRDRDEMFRRTLASPLFRTQLAGPCTVASAAWGAPADWRVAVVNRPADDVRAALRGTCALLIVNAPRECVLGGRADDVARTIAGLGCEALTLEGVPTVHLGLVEAVAAEYRALHLLPTHPPEGVRFYSGAWAKAYVPTQEGAADSILANAVGGFDFRATVEQAYADGVRIFVEPGPQGSCTRMISRILGGRPHLAVAADQRGVDGYRSLLVALGRLAEAGVAVDLEPIYGVGRGVATEVVPRPAGVSLPVGVRRPVAPARPRPEDARTVSLLPNSTPHLNGTSTSRDSVEQVLAAPARVSSSSAESGTQAQLSALNAASVLTSARALADAHEAFLRLAKSSVELQTRALLEQQRLIALLESAGPTHWAAQSSETDGPTAQTVPPPAFDRAACEEFASGKLSAVLGPAFASVDAHPTRVRLPTGPLMLVDRIVTVEGTPGVLGPGRCVTEHEVRPGAWYLDGGRAPVCISVEAGQADLFLSAYLGIDLQTRGERVYRLLDAKITFHRDLPRVGETVRYDIKIDRFIQQGDTWLFFFRFDGTIGGAPFITMYDGCAGFFSAEQLKSGRGIVGEPTNDQPAPRAGTTRFAPLVATERSSLDEGQLEALRTGDLGAAFGGAFLGRALAPGLRLPSGQLHLVDRILELDPAGGRFGLGLVHGEADVTPDAWYLTCHFADDPVMPGTLMYECCLHTLRVLLLRLGWIAEGDAEVHCAPIEGAASQLRCRGQVTPETKKVSYRVELKELGYDPEPYVIATAAMFADDRHVVEMDGMSLKIRGLTRAAVEATWSAAPTPKPVRYSREQILAYAEGNPSEGFGEPYRPFDRDRRLARLPRPPFLFLDRVRSVDAPPWVMKPGGWVEGEFDVAPDAWYFAANRQAAMPFAVLLEAALQPCGWLAAYAGSALCSEQDLHFRNLDGEATAFAEVRRDAGTLTSRARMTKASQAGGMILQEFELEILAGKQRVYAGTTGFGFFPKEALAQQVGVRGAALLALPSGGRGFDVPREAPLTPGAATGFSPHGLSLPARAFSMIDTVEALELEGGPHGKGFVAGSKTVDPDEWFFTAHFFQDPVMPGSLGLEALTQLLKLFARERFGKKVTTHRFESMALGQKHKWQYRGQVIPTNTRVQVQAVITVVHDGPEPLLLADGQLAVDGRVIYTMKDFSLRLVPEER